MNFKALTLTAILAVATPAIADLAVNTAAVAQASTPSGTFQDANWAVTLRWHDGAFWYIGRNKRTGAEIALLDPAFTGESHRRVYTWSNNGTLYQVTWRPNEPNIIRLTVMDANGQVPINRLLRR
ncbi:hypothetical protein K4A83_12410 [Spirulina subsalsa FACHB-351]|uniref:Uncharacterized protein n=1 Tax=Spirulina subsalsa FACHB-351 TaxID=234711 RepID=A0ABT3L6D8_9CYAN|nr:hypothetical protein [Spirulina subsalsa]MCW6037064.1 hypothetical protein [Spirulina subsalsa FACHB-351]